MVFKVLNEDTEKWTQNVQFLGKSFSQIGENGLKAWAKDINIDVITRYNAAVAEGIKLAEENTNSLKTGYSAEELYNLALIDKTGNTIECNDATKELIKNANGAAISESTVANAMGQVGISSKLAAIGTQALNMALNALVGMGISLAISLIAKGLDSLIHLSENLKKKVNELNLTYSGLKDEIENINKELETNNNRLKELQSLGSLTFVEEQELKKLKEVNEELKISLDLKEKAANIAQKEAEKAALKLYGLEVNKLNPFTWETEGASSYIENYIRSAEAVRNRIKEIESKSVPTALEKDILPSLKSQYEGQENFLVKYAMNLDELKSSLHDISPEAVRAKEDINSVLDMVHDFVTGVDIVPANVRRAIDESKSALENLTRENILEIGVKVDANIDTGVLSQAEMAYARLTEISNEYGYSMEDLLDTCEHFGYIQASVAESLNETGSAFDEQLNSIKEASVAYNLLMSEYTNTGEISYETYRKVIAGNEDLEKSFTNVNGVLGLNIDTLKEWIAAKQLDTVQTMIQNGATKEEIATVYEMINVIQQELDIYQSTMAVRNQLVEEFNQNGEISYETYQKLVQGGSDYVAVIEKVNGKYTLNIQKMNELDEASKTALEKTLALNNASEKQIASAGKLAPLNESVAQSYGEIVSEISTLSGWLEQTNEGYEFSAIEILNLIEKYPELASKISITTNGYRLEAAALRDLIVLKAQNLKLTAQAGVAEASKVVVEKSNNQATVDNALALVGNDTNSYEDWLKAWRKEWNYGDDKAPNIEGVKELVEAAINEKNMQNAINQIIEDIENSASSGNVKQGYDPTKKTSTKKEETEFSKQLKQLKYEKEAFEAHMQIDDGVYNIDSAEKYYETLQKLAKTAYDNGEIDLNEYRQYVLEAFKGLNEEANIFEEQMKQLQYEKKALDAGMKITDGQYNLKSTEDYYRAVQELSKLAYESGEIDLAEYRDYAIECYAKLREAEEKYFSDTISMSEYRIYQFKRESDAQNKQLDAYQQMQELILAKKQEYIQQGYDLTSEEIQNLESAYASFGERISEILASSVDQSLIDEYRGMMETLAEKRKWYLQNGYDETSTELRNLQKEYDSFADAIVSIMESAAKRVASAQKAAIDQVVSSMKTTTSAMNTVLDAVVNYIKREKDAEKSAIQDQIKGLNDMYKSAYDTEKKYYSDLIQNTKDSYTTQKKEADKYFSGIMDSAKKAYDAQKDNLSNLLNSYKRIIDAQKESLKTAKDNEKYQREVANKNKDITSMKNKLSILELDDSDEARAKRLELIEKIKDAEQDLTDYQNDYAYNQQVSALDKEYKAYEDNIKAQQELLEQQYNSMKELYEAQKEAHMEMLESNNNATIQALENERDSKLAAMEEQHESEVAALEQKIADIDEYLKKEGTLRRDANARIEEEGQELWDKLMEYEYEYSKDITSLQEAWAIANGAMQTYGQEQGNILNTMRSMNDEMEKLIAKSNALANIGSYVSTMKQNSVNWHTSDSATQSSLHNQNVAMGTALGAEYKNGVWYLNGKPLYTFHSGAEKGFVLDDPKIKSNEVLAKLAAGEIVMTPTQLDRLGTEMYQAGMAKLMSLMNAQSQNSDCTFEMHFYGDVTKETLPSLERTIKTATDTILDEVQNRNSRRGTKVHKFTY